MAKKTMTNLVYYLQLVVIVLKKISVIDQVHLQQLIGTKDRFSMIDLKILTKR